MTNHAFKPYADAPELCVAELPNGETCNGDRATHAKCPKHTTHQTGCGTCRYALVFGVAE